MIQFSRTVLGKIRRQVSLITGFCLPPNVNNAKGYIFVHIPKTAGTSMCEALGLSDTMHETAIDYRRMLGGRYDELYRFAFVRNPWDRFLSLYMYARMEESHHHSASAPHSKKCGKHPDYETLKHTSIQDAAALLIAGQLSFQWLPQHRWVCDENGKVIVDFVGRVEAVEHDWPVVAARVGGRTNMPRRNVANVEKVPYQQVLDSKTKALLDDYYKKDVELFGYQF